MARITAEAFGQAGALPEQEVTLPSKGGSVLVRGFTKAVQQRLRREALRDGEMDTDKMELAMVAHGMVDPVLTVEETQHAFDTWPAADMDAILQAVLEVNGLAPGFAREAAVTFREEPGG